MREDENKTSLININDALGVGKSIDKLISVTENGLGAWWRPYQLKRMAKAEAEAVVTQAKILKDATDKGLIATTDSYKIAANIKGEAEGIVAASETLKEAYKKGSLPDSNLTQRAMARVAYQETERQAIIEEVVDKAQVLLPDEVTDEQVDKGWSKSFFKSVEDVTDEDMKTIWAKLLAGEIIKPNSYSLRSIEILKTMSSIEAEVFRKICSLRVHKRLIMLIDNKVESLQGFGVAYDDILLLQSAGLIHISDRLQSIISLQKTSDRDSYASVFNVGGFYRWIEHKTQEEVRLTHSINRRGI